MTIIQYVDKFMLVGDEWKTVEVENKFEVTNYDDLQNLLLTIIDFSTKDVKFRVIKEEVA